MSLTAIKFAYTVLVLLSSVAFGNQSTNDPAQQKKNSFLLQKTEDELTDEHERNHSRENEAYFACRKGTFEECESLAKHCLKEQISQACINYAAHLFYEIKDFNGAEEVLRKECRRGEQYACHLYANFTFRLSYYCKAGEVSHCVELEKRCAHKNTEACTYAWQLLKKKKLSTEPSERIRQELSFILKAQLRLKLDCDTGNKKSCEEYGRICQSTQSFLCKDNLQNH